MKATLKSTLLFAALSPLAMAQASAQNGALDEIVVTSSNPTNITSALKMGLPLIDVPQSLSLVGQEEIKMRGYNELADLVRYTPGVNTTQGEGHRDAIVFRGVRSTADFFLDGVRDDVQYYRPLYNLEQVEILRGPNALLFGRGGTGGAVNRVTKKAIIGKSTNNVDFGADSFGGYDLSADINIATSDTSAFRLNAMVESLENDRDFFDGDRIGFNPTLKLALDGKTTLDLSYEYMDHERFIDRGIPTANSAPAESLSDIVFGSPTDNTTTLEASIVRGSVTRQFSDTTVGTLNVHYGDNEKMYQNLYAAGYDADANTVTLDGYRDPTERTNTIISGHLTTKARFGGMGHTLLVGGEYVDTESENLRYNSYFSSARAVDMNDDQCDSSSDDDAFRTDQETFDIAARLDLANSANNGATDINFSTCLNNQTETDITVTSLFVQDQIAVTDNLQVLIGARFDDVDITVNDIKGSSSASRQDDEISPRAGLIYKPQNNLSVYASYSESFLPRSGEQFKKLSSSSAQLDPDVFENTEFGVKWNVSDTLFVSAGYFENEQTRAERDNDTGEQYEVRGLEVDGFEIEVKGEISKKLSLTAGYSSLDGTTASGTTPRELPETMISLFAEYVANARFGYGLGLTYQDESQVKDGNSSPILPDYTRVDASAYYHLSDDLTLLVNIENLLDEDYFPHSHSTHQVTVGDPMNVQISLSRQF